MAGALVLGDELIFPSEFLSYVDLQGKSVTVTIESLNAEDLQTKGGRGARKLVAKLVGKKKKFAMNKTNCALTAEVHGNQAQNWIGKKLVLKPSKDRFGREVVDCIRVDVELTRKAATATPQEQLREPGEET